MKSKFNKKGRIRRFFKYLAIATVLIGLGSAGNQWFSANPGALSKLFTLWAGQTLSGRVVSVSDGDTITVLDAQNIRYDIRLVGIDAPEKTQSYGNYCKFQLSQLILGKHVTVEWSEKDRHGRVLGKMIEGEADMGLKMIELGCAWFYEDYKDGLSWADQAAYAAAEAQAKTSKIGLWVDTDAVSPQEFRRGH